MDNQDDVKMVEELKAHYNEIKGELAKVIQGQEEVINRILMCVFSRGHALLMGVPGLAKTLMISSLSETMDLGFNRIQFTPDLMPSDITGTEILQEDENGVRSFKFIQGPVFSNIVLADEINRTSAKTQASLLEAMQEHRVTVLGKTYTLEQPFFVLATQNPIEQEGTYPLPEAQLDRFMYFIEVEYPSFEEELNIAKNTTGNQKPKLEKVINGADIIKYQELIRRVPVPDHIYKYAVDIVRATRPSKDSKQWVQDYIAWGAGPRAVQYLILGAKAHAALNGSYMVRADDIDIVAQAVLTHRIQLSFQAESEGMTSNDLITRLLSEIDVMD